MAEKIYQLTRDGYKQLEKKLKILKTKERAEVAERIRQAKEFGQLEENTEYENAKEEQAKLERDIAKLEEVLRNSKILEKRESTSGKVDVGSMVSVEYVEEARVLQFEIVSSQESNPMRTPPRISEESPLGASLMVKEPGETVEVETPIGIAHYRIIEAS